MPPSYPDKLSRKEAARYLTSLGYRIAPKTLANLAANNNARKGPPFIRYGWTSVVYDRGALETWVRERVTEFA